MTWTTPAPAMCEKTKPAKGLRSEHTLRPGTAPCPIA